MTAVVASGDLQFRSRVRAIAWEQLTFLDVESAERVARGLHANPSRMEHELALKLRDDRISCLTQVEIPVTTADFYFPLESRPLIVFVDGPVHVKTAQMMKDEELGSLLRKRGYRVLELSYSSYTDKKRDELYREIFNGIGK